MSEPGPAAAQDDVVDDETDLAPARYEGIFRATPTGPMTPALRARSRDVAARLAATRERDELPAGSVVGPYEIAGVLGSGGQATVYRARHRATGREVALKVPRAEVAARLHREIAILVHLDHPRIVRIEEAALDGPIPYLAMELLRGGSLADLVARREPLGRVRVEAIARGVLEALEYAHARGVVHRDVKPANIVFDERGEPKVADFGIGKLAVSAEAAVPGGAAKSTTVVAGTPAYMAPEQEDPARAEGGHVDGRADLYALGKVLYEALTGASARTIRPLPTARLGLPAEWSDFLFHLVEERPQDRCPSAGAAREALDYLATLPPAREEGAPPAGGDALVAAARAYERGFAAGRAQAGGAPAGRTRLWLASLLGLAAVAIAAAWIVEAPRAPALILFALGSMATATAPLAALASWLERRGAKP